MTPEETELLQALRTRVAELEQRLERGQFEVQKLVLRGPQGELRALLGTDTDGQTSLSMLDDQGVVRAQLVTGDEGTSLVLADSCGDLRAALHGALGTESVTALELRGGAGTARALVAVPDDADPVFTLCDAMGHPRTSMLLQGLVSPTSSACAASREHEAAMEDTAAVDPRSRLELPPGLEAELRELADDPAAEDVAEDDDETA